MQAYNNKKETKEFYLDRITAHFKADEIIKGRYWEGGKGCAVGCTIHSGNHKKYETELGIPQMLARLEDRIFEGLPNEQAKQWPVDFLKTIKVGSDLSNVSWQFLHWLILDLKISDKYSELREAVKECADIIKPLTKGNKVERNLCLAIRTKILELRGKIKWPDAAYAAAAADAYAAYADAAADAAAYAAAAAAAAAYAAAYAAYAAAAADAAAYAAYAAAAADAYAAYADAAAAARGKYYIKMSEKLLELIREAA